MINQIKVENYKFARSVFFWLALAFIAIIGIYNGFKWDVTAHITELDLPFEQALPDMSFVFMPALFTAWFIGNSFSTRTIQHEITSGSSRFSIIISRSLPVILASVVLHAAYVVLTIVTLGSRIGFGPLSFDNAHLMWIGTVLLQIVALECFFILINFLCCNLYVGLIVSVVSAFTLVNVFRNIFRDAIWYKYSFFHFVEEANKSDLFVCAVVATVSIVVLTVISYLVFKKKEI